MGKRRRIEIGQIARVAILVKTFGSVFRGRSKLLTSSAMSVVIPPMVIQCNE